MTVIAGLGGGAGPAKAPTKTATRGALVLLAPGMLYLVAFFVVPVFALLATSLYVRVPGGDVGQFQPAFEWHNYVTAVGTYWPQMVRSFAYALIATVLSLVIGYPMAYVIAVRARGKPFLQGMLLVLVIAPFFTSFILRTIAWKQILADQGFVVSALRSLSLLPPSGRLTATSIAVVAGLTYNFLPFMVAADLRQPRADGRATAGGGCRPVRQRPDDVLEGHPAAVDAGCGVRDAAHLHPGIG